MACIKVTVHGPEKKTIETREMAEVKEFRAAISKAFDMPIERTQLMYEGQHLEDLMTLASYGIRDGETVLLHYAAYASDCSDIASVDSRAGGGDVSAAEGEDRVDADKRHGEEAGPSDAPSSSQKRTATLKCRQCDATFSSGVLYSEHVLKHKEETARKQMASATVQPWLQEQQQEHESTVIDVAPVFTRNPEELRGERIRCQLVKCPENGLGIRMDGYDIRMEGSDQADLENVEEFLRIAGINPSTPASEEGSLQIGQYYDGNVMKFAIGSFSLKDAK